ncbi:MAG: hypothetical protein HQL30_07220 [Candidatus Omnitrophica bacterium]|nr:hypothetical protein [Candidatus Omnitrophota bacterium]
MAGARKFELKVMNTEGVILRKPVESVFVQGDSTEFEILAFHYPVMSVFKGGKIIVDWKEYMPIKNGILKFSENECLILTD